MLNTKVTKNKSKIPGASGFIKKASYDAKMEKIIGKFIITLEFNKYLSNIFDAKIKKANLISKAALNADVAEIEKNI